MLDYKFNLFEIYNYNRFGQLKYFFEYIKKNHKKYKGDIVEAGVHKGKSLLSIGLFLKELKSKKKSLWLRHIFWVSEKSKKSQNGPAESMGTLA